MRYGNYQIGKVKISKVYYVEGLEHNLFSVGQFCDSDLELAFIKHTCFVRNLKGVDLLLGSQGTNLYSLSIGDMKASSPICLLSKATKTKSWLWHRRLSYLNFGALNHLPINGLVRGLPRLKFEKDHLCSACAMGKTSVAFLVLVEEAPALVELTSSPSSITVDQDAPYLSTVDPTLFISRKGKDILLILQIPRGIFLNQSKYALESLKKCKMESCDQVDTPMVEKSKLDKDTQGKAIDPPHYRGMVSTLMYLTSSRPYLVVKIHDVVHLEVCNYWETDLLAGHKKGRKAMRYPVRKLNI
nr:integrase, catalytic region, zinc finger, CCHC-type, peptidase aspartic, catalytic [Tanacetum cinerariifolium]